MSNLITLTNEAEIEAKFKIDATDIVKCVFNKHTNDMYLVSEEGITVFEESGDIYDVENEAKAIWCIN